MRISNLVLDLSGLVTAMPLTLHALHLSQLTITVQKLQALSTPAIAFFAFVLGVAQWRTAHQRAVLDLFARRMEMSEEHHRESVRSVRPSSREKCVACCPITTVAMSGRW
jgi:hypothetical protein